MSDEAEYNEEQDQNLIDLCVQFTNGKTGREVNAAVYNSNERKFYVTEFGDNEHFSNFESLILQINPQNTYAKFSLLIKFPQLSTEREKITDILSLCEVEPIEKDKEPFPTKNIQGDLDLLLKKPFTTYIKESQFSNALSSLMCIVSHRELLKEKSNLKQFSLDSYSLTKFMKLDLAAINALSIFPKNNLMNTNANEENGTLLGLLDKCKTQIGSRCLKRWLKQPLQDIDEINKRLDCVECLVGDKNLLVHLQNEFLRKIPDLDKLYSKFYKVHSKKKHNGNLVDCIKVYQVVNSLKALCDFLGSYMANENDSVIRYFLPELKSNLEDFAKFEEMIEQSIDMDKAKRGEYMITASFSPKLTQINKELNKILGEIEKHRKSVENDLDGCDVKMGESNTHTYLFEVNKKEGDDAFRKSSKKYKTISIKQRTISFTTTDLTELVADYNEQKGEYKSEQSQVVGKILEVVSTYYPAMERASSLIAELDCLASLAHVSANAPNPYVRPKLTKGGNLVMKECRHPCLALIDASKCIANDCEMYKGKSILHIITGPNMGGKSTYIRQVAIAALLAHIGCFVPCASAEIPLIDAVITRVGASDMQLKGISTFMSEMLETSCMLKIGTENSLLIVDELGRGTSTSEGFGLSWAVAEYIVKHIKGYCLFATHFHELTIMEGQIPGVKNFYVSAISKDGQLTMQYKVRPGAVDRSYGLFVADLLNFPEKILKDGRLKAKELERFEEADGEGNGEEIEEEEEVKSEKMDIEGNNLVYYAKKATNQQKLKVLGLIPGTLAQMKGLKNKEEKLKVLRDLIGSAKGMLAKESEA